MLAWIADRYELCRPKLRPLSNHPTAKIASARDAGGIRRLRVRLTHANRARANDTMKPAAMPHPLAHHEISRSDSAQSPHVPPAAPLTPRSLRSKPLGQKLFPHEGPRSRASYPQVASFQDELISTYVHLFVRPWNMHACHSGASCQCSKYLCGGFG